MKEQLTPKELSAKIAEATDRNDRTGCVALLAGFVGGKWPKIVQHIQALQDIEGSLPDGLYEYRKEVRQRLFKALAGKVPPQDYELIRKSF